MLNQTDRYPGFAETYKHNGVVIMPQFFEAEFLKSLSSYFSRNFKKTAVMNECDEYLLDDDAVLIKLYHIFNSEKFLKPLTQAFGLGRCECISRLYYNDKSCNHLTWHDDSYSKSGRFAAIRIELSETSYEGGDFHFEDRDQGTKPALPKMKFGDAVLFKITAKRFFHMVGPITTGTRRSLIIFLTTKDPDDTIR